MLLNKNILAIGIVFLFIVSSITPMAFGYNVSISDIREQQNATKSDGTKDSAWPMKSHDVRHTGRSPYNTAHIDGLEKWRFHSDDWFDESPIIDSDGTIYAGSGRELYAINPDGSLKWI